MAPCNWLLVFAQALYTDVGLQQPRVLSLLYQAAQLLDNNRADLEPEQLKQLDAMTSDVRERIDSVSRAHFSAHRSLVHV